MSPWRIFIQAVAGLLAAGEASASNVAGHAFAKSRSRHPATKLSTEKSELRSDRPLKASSAGLVNLVSQELDLDRRAIQAFKDRDARDASSRDALPSSLVHHLVRSELVPETKATAISTRVGDLYAHIKGAHSLRGLSLQVARAGFVGFLVLLFVMTLRFSAQRLSKARSPAKPPQMEEVQHMLAVRAGPFAIGGQVPMPPAGPNKAPQASSLGSQSRLSTQTKAGTAMKAITGRMSALLAGLHIGQAVSASRAKVRGKPGLAAAAEAKAKAILKAAPDKFQPVKKAHMAPGSNMPAAAVAQRRSDSHSSTSICHPWHTLPSPEMLLSVGPTFHVNLPNVLPHLLRARGLQPAAKGNVAMVSLWNWPGQRQRALVELCVQDTLANKRAFAIHLTRSRLTGMAPLTFLSPADLQRALRPQQPKAPCQQRRPVPALPRDRREGLWFLKHAKMDNNLGVVCFHGVEDLLKHWTNDIPMQERLHYVAQAEVQRPLLSPGFASQQDGLAPRKVTIRAYVLVLGTGRCFLHREMLLKTHPNPYNSKDPDPMQHITCHVKYDGVSASRATDWSRYAEVWPKIGEMMSQCFNSFDFEALQDEAIFDEYDFWPWQRFGKRLWAFLVLFICWIPLLRNLVKQPTRRNLDEADSMKYALLGLDIIVDESLRPWCIELNRSPTLNYEPRDPVGSKLKAEVVEDFCELLIDPVLHAAASASRARPAPSAWGRLQQWATEHRPRTMHEPQRGFVELPSPKMMTEQCPGAVGAVLAAKLEKDRAPAAEVTT